MFGGMYHLGVILSGRGAGGGGPRPKTAFGPLRAIYLTSSSSPRTGPLFRPPQSPPFPSSLPRQHILQFACSKAGLVLYHLDPAQAVTDPEGAKAALKTALEVTEANILVSQEAGSDVNYVRLCEDVIPEIRIFDFGDGMPFVTPRFPHLRVPVHTGFDVDEKRGMEPLKHLLCPAGTVKAMLGDLGTKIDGSTPLLGELTVGKDGLLAKGKVLSNDEVMKKKLWPVVTSMLQREYLEVGGVGVVW